MHQKHLSWMAKGVIHYRLAGDVNERVWNETLKPIYDKLAEKP